MTPDVHDGSSGNPDAGLGAMLAVLATVSQVMTCGTSVCCTFVSIVGVPISMGLSIAAIVFSNRARKVAAQSGEGESAAMLGLILGCINLLLSLVAAAFTLVTMTAVLLAAISQ